MHGYLWLQYCTYKICKISYERSTHSGRWLSIVGITSIFCFIAISGRDRNRNNSHILNNGNDGCNDDGVEVMCVCRCWCRCHCRYRYCCYCCFSLNNLFPASFPYTKRSKMSGTTGNGWMVARMTRPDFPSSKQFSVSAFCVFLFGSASFPLPLFTTKLLSSGIYMKLQLHHTSPHHTQKMIKSRGEEKKKEKEEKSHTRIQNTHFQHKTMDKKGINCEV